MDFARGKRQAVEPHAAQTASQPVLLFGSKKRSLPRVIEQLCLSWLDLPDLRYVFFASRDASALVLRYFTIMRELKLPGIVDNWILSMASQRCRSLTSLDIYFMDKEPSRVLVMQQNTGTLRRLALHCKVADLSSATFCQSLEHLRFQTDEWDKSTVPKEFSPLALSKLVSLDLAGIRAIRLLALGSASLIHIASFPQLQSLSLSISKDLDTTFAEFYLKFSSLDQVLSKLTCLRRLDIEYWASRQWEQPDKIPIVWTLPATITDLQLRFDDIGLFPIVSAPGATSVSVKLIDARTFAVLNSATSVRVLKIHELLDPRSGEVIQIPGVSELLCDALRAGRWPDLQQLTIDSVGPDAPSFFSALLPSARGLRELRVSLDKLASTADLSQLLHWSPLLEDLSVKANQTKDSERPDAADTEPEPQALPTTHNLRSLALVAYSDALFRYVQFPKLTSLELRTWCYGSVYHCTLEHHLDHPADLDTVLGSCPLLETLKLLGFAVSLRSVIHTSLRLLDCETHRNRPWPCDSLRCLPKLTTLRLTRVSVDIPGLVRLAETGQLPSLRSIYIWGVVTGATTASWYKRLILACPKLED